MIYKYMIGTKELKPENVLIFIPTTKKNKTYYVTGTIEACDETEARAILNRKIKKDYKNMEVKKFEELNKKCLE